MASVNPAFDKPDVVEVHTQPELESHLLEQVAFQCTTTAQVKAQIDAGITLPDTGCTSQSASLRLL